MIILLLIEILKLELIVQLFNVIMMIKFFSKVFLLFQFFFVVLYIFYLFYYSEFNHNSNNFIYSILE